MSRSRGWVHHATWVSVGICAWRVRRRLISSLGLVRGAGGRVSGCVSSGDRWLVDLGLLGLGVDWRRVSALRVLVLVWVRVHCDYVISFARRMWRK
jgi:hypothetical protein